MLSRRSRLRVDNVFVLGTGRCGTATFVAACDRVENFTSGHETRAAAIGDERFAYPGRHIEADNRLSWFLGELGRRYDDDSTLFVHLRRDRDDVVRSFERRWDSPFRASVIRAFAHGIVMRRDEWQADDIRRVCEFYVDTVTANVAAFVATRRSLTIDLETSGEQFPGFLDEIDATGDRTAILAELAVRHNAG